MKTLLCLIFILPYTTLWGQDRKEKEIIIDIYVLEEEHILYKVYDQLIDTIKLKYYCDSPQYLSLSIQSDSLENLNISLGSNNWFRFLRKSDFSDSKLIGIIIKNSIVFCYDYEEYKNSFFKGAKLVDRILIDDFFNSKNRTSCNSVFYRKKEFNILYKAYFAISNNNKLIFDEYIDLVEFGDYFLFKKKDRNKLNQEYNKLTKDKIINLKELKTFIYNCIDRLEEKNSTLYKEIKAINLTIGKNGKINDFSLSFNNGDLSLSKKEKQFLYSLFRGKNFKKPKETVYDENYMMIKEFTIRFSSVYR